MTSTRMHGRGALVSFGGQGRKVWRLGKVLESSQKQGKSLWRSWKVLEIMKSSRGYKKFSKERRVLRPKALEGRAKFWRAGKVPKIRDILEGTENSGSSQKQRRVLEVMESSGSHGKF